MLWLRRRRLPEQVDRAGSIALVFQTRKLEEGGDLHTKSVKRKGRFLENPPIVTGGVEIRRLPCLFLSKSNGGARKGAVSATWLMAKSQPVQYIVGNCDPVSLAFLGRDPSFPHFLPSGFRH